MASDEAYMLRRDHEESGRLNAQHVFMRELAHGHLVQPSIPQSSLRTIADVGTGTGVWLREVAQELAAKNGGFSELVGFDISSQQFIHDDVQGVDFVVHDVVEPFPQQYHERFDLVNVRLLSYALKAQDLGKAVENIIRILRPGGFLQWQECDAIDSWAIPEMANARSTIAYVVSERISRGLTPAIVSPLTKTIQSFSATVPAGKVSPLSWTEDLVRIMHLETISTTNHPSPAVQAGKKQVIMGVALQLLQTGASRRQTRATHTQVPALEQQELKEDAEAIMQLVEAWKEGKDPACSEWDCALTSIIARKTILVNEHGEWLSTRY